MLGQDLLPDRGAVGVAEIGDPAAEEAAATTTGEETDTTIAAAAAATTCPRPPKE